MSKKRGKRPVSNTVSNYQRQQAELAARRPPLVDRVANWLGARSRPIRTLICAGIALIFTLATAIILYNSLYATDPRRLNFGIINNQNILLVSLILLTVAGFVFYWAGWRVMIGFDFEETPLRPGRAAALWVIFGLMILVFVLIFGGITIYLALQD